MAAESLTPTELRTAVAALPAARTSPGISRAFAVAWNSVRAIGATPLFCLLLATFVVRIGGIDRPIVSTFATKSAVYAMVARNWALGRAPVWRPTIDCVADGERAWHLMEWPAPAYAAGLGWSLFGGSLDAWGRGISIVASLFAVFFVYRLSERWFGARAAQAAGFVLAFSPVSIIYGQSLLLEASLAALLLATLDCFDTWLATRKVVYLAASALACGLAVLTKIYLLLAVVPLVAMLVVSSRSSRTKLAPRMLLAALVFGVALLLPAAWYYYVFTVSPTSGPAAEYHPLSRATIHGFPHPLLFTPSYYARLGIDLFTVVLTPLGVLLAGVGIIDGRFRRHLPLLATFCCLPILFPLKFLVANYYYVVLLPALAFAVGLGWQRWNERYVPSLRTKQFLVACTLLIALRYAIGPAFRTPTEDRGVVAAAEVVRSATHAEERIVTMHGSTLDLLYYCDRPGWALDVADPQLSKKLTTARHEGARKLIVVGMDSVARQPATSELLASLVLEQSGDDWRLYSLVAPAPSPAP
ncbi:MAG: glycosyltransferase family 39 protein [Planctomycetia bacterium]|nr:glycosyltransferase family 39 protein [Planctomycetia bacterium]